MLDVRANLVARAAGSLARALTIDVRYSLVRVQGFDPTSSGEGAEGAQFNRCGIGFDSKRCAKPISRICGPKGKGKGTWGARASESLDTACRGQGDCGEAASGTHVNDDGGLGTKRRAREK